MDPIYPLHVNLRTGTVMSLAGTATGRLFAAYLPRQLIGELMKDDYKRLGPDIAHPLGRQPHPGRQFLRGASVRLLRQHRAGHHADGFLGHLRPGLERRAGRGHPALRGRGVQTPGAPSDNRFPSLNLGVAPAGHAPPYPALPACVSSQARNWATSDR